VLWNYFFLFFFFYTFIHSCEFRHLWFRQEASKLVTQDSFKLVAHEAVNDEVCGSIEDEEPVHEAGETQEPGRGDEVGTHEDAVGHQKLRTVDEKSWEVTDEEDDDNTDEDTSKVHLIAGGTVTV